MTTDVQIPPNRPFGPGRLETRREHLVAEIRRTSRQPQRRFRPLSWSPRVLAFGLAASAASALLAVVAVRELDGRSPGRSDTRVVVAAAGPVATWNGIVLTGPCLGASFVGSGCLMRGKSSDAFAIDVPRLTTGRAEDGVELLGGTPAERLALRRIVERMPGHTLTRIEIMPQRAEDSVTLRFSATGGDGLRNDWEGMLVAGAYRDLAHERGLRPLVGFPPPSPVAPRSPETMNVEARVRAAAAAAGARVHELRIYEPDGLAVLVVLRAPDPDRFLKQELPAVLEALGDRWREYDGTFVEVVDEDGAFVWAAGTTPRTSHGSVGTREGLEGCSPVANWGPTPPPCPGA